MHYQDALRDAELTHVKDIHDYIPRLKDDRYSVLISVMGDASAAMDEETAQALMDLGLSEDLRELQGDAYAAVIDAGEVLLEERSEDYVWDRGSIREGKTFFHIDSSGLEGDSDGWASIRINEVEHSKQRPGINIVVVLRQNCACFDSVNFDTATAGQDGVACVR